MNKFLISSVTALIISFSTVGYAIDSGENLSKTAYKRDYLLYGAHKL
jgi:hypothetical protein